VTLSWFFIRQPGRYGGGTFPFTTTELLT